MRSILIAVLMAAVACSAPAPSDGGVHWSVRDSAGVEIAVNGGRAPRWRLDERPLLELGEIDKPGPTQFYRVRGVELLDDGGVAVANQGSEELRIFSGNGGQPVTAGGRGHGPQEFDGLALVEVVGDSLLTWDGGNQRLSIRLLDGSLVRTFSLEWLDGLLFPVDVTGGEGAPERRGVVTVTARYMSQLRGSGLVVDTALVSFYAMDGTLVDSLGRVPHNARAVLRVENRQTTLPAPYRVGASLVGHERGFCYVFGSVPELRCHDRHGLRRIVRVDVPIEIVTEEHLDLWWEQALETTNERRRSALRRMRDHMPFPSEFPAFDELLRDDRGRLWVRRYRTPEVENERWLVFEDGKWVGQLETPPGYEVMDVRGNQLAGVWRTPLGVEFIRVYRFTEN